MKIIFLDIDGVLNISPVETDKYGDIFKEHFTNNLKKLIENTGAKIVLSSSWRKKGLKYMQEMWVYRKLAGEIIDVTPSLYLKRNGSLVFYNDKLSQHPTPKIKGYSIPRGCEIEYWLKNESVKFGKIESYVILDDDNDMLLNQKDNFLLCDNGLTDDIVNYAVNILNI